MTIIMLERRRDRGTGPLMPARGPGERRLENPNGVSAVRARVAFWIMARNTLQHLQGPPDA
jgi:hypothetical protein